MDEGYVREILEWVRRLPPRNLPSRCYSTPKSSLAGQLFCRRLPASVRTGGDRTADEHQTLSSMMHDLFQIVRPLGCLFCIIDVKLKSFKNIAPSGDGVVS